MSASRSSELTLPTEPHRKLPRSESKRSTFDATGRRSPMGGLSCGATVLTPSAANESPLGHAKTNAVIYATVKLKPDAFRLIMNPKISSDKVAGVR